VGNIHKISTKISTENFAPLFLGIDINAIGETMVLVSPVLTLLFQKNLRGFKLVERGVVPPEGGVPW